MAQKSPARKMAPLIRSDHWNLLMEYVAGEKSRLVTQLLNCNEQDLKALQGEHKALEKLEKLKDQLRQETNT